MSFLVSLFIIFLFFFVPLVFYRRVYFSAVTTIYVEPGVTELRLVKPNKDWFKDQSRGQARGFVHLGSGLYAFYCNQDEDLSSSDSLSISGSLMPSGIYIFKRSRFGRFQSVDMSSRSLVEVISKFLK